MYKRLLGNATATIVGVAALKSGIVEVAWTTTPAVLPAGTKFILEYRVKNS